MAKISSYCSDSIKEYYKLLLEYLKRSERYAEFCDWPFINRNKKSARYPFKGRFKESPFLNYYGHPFGLIYLRWGDVRHKDAKDAFERWWKGYCNFDERFGVSTYDSNSFFFDFYIALYPVDNMAFWKFVDKIKNEFENEKVFKEVLEKFLKFLPEFYNELIYPNLESRIISHPNRILLSIFLPLTKSLKQFRNSVNNYLDKLFKKVIRNTNGRYFSPLGVGARLRKPELERYLKIYDLRKQGKTWRQIASEIDIYSKRDFNEELANKLRKEMGKALKIMKNIEKGVFPGKY